MLCIRFVNWPIQQLRRNADSIISDRLVVHTSAPASSSGITKRSSKTGSATDQDRRHLLNLFPAVRTGPTVIAVSETAWRDGIRPGMPLAEARSLAIPVRNQKPRKPPASRNPQQKLPRTSSAAIPAIQFHEWKPQEERRQLRLAAELTRRYAPIVGLDEMPWPDSLLLDITGCAPLFGSESALAQMLLNDFRESGYECCLATADSVAASWALAHETLHQAEREALGAGSGKKHRPVPLPMMISPPGLDQVSIQDLPVRAARLNFEDMSTLSQLGLRTVRQLLDLPLEDLPARLSDDGLQRLRQLHGMIPEMIHPIPELSPVSASWQSEFPAESRQEILQVMEFLLQQICEQLERRRVGCRRAVFRFIPMMSDSAQEIQEETVPGQVKDPDHRQNTLSVELIRCTQSFERLQELCRLRLETMAFPGPVGQIEIQVRTGPMPTAQQRDLFGELRHVAVEDELAQLADRLSSRLGRDRVVSVQMADDARPEHAVRYLPIVADSGPEEADRVSTSGASSGAVGSYRSAESGEGLLERLVTPQSETEGETIFRITRPLRLLPVPFLLSKRTEKQSVPPEFLLPGRSFQVRRIVGPERIQSGWWTETPIQRDYYRVSDESAAMLWIYRDLGTGAWYLHGIFD